MPKVKISKTWLMICLCAIAAVSTGCGKAQPVIPDKFCKVSLKKSTVSALIPKGGSVEQEYHDQGARRNECYLLVDDRVILSVALRRWDDVSTAFQWREMDRAYERQRVSFAGVAKIEDEHAVVQANCDTKTMYMTFSFSSYGSKGALSNQKKLQRFVNDLVPKETKRFGCTK